MTTFRYQAVELNGATVSGVVEAADRRTALDRLSARGLFPSSLETSTASTVAIADTNGSASPVKTATEPEVKRPGGFKWGSGIGRKEITAFTREMASLLESAIPIPQALDGLGEEEENPALKSVVCQIADSVRTGSSFSSALESHPRLFTPLYVSMVKVGEEAGALHKVMGDLAKLLEHEDEVRGEVMAAVAYPAFVLGFGVFTVVILLTVVLPKLFSMLREMLDVLPLPTRVLLGVSGFLQANWWWIIPGLVGGVFGLRAYLRTPSGALGWDKWKLRVPVMGGVLRAAALGRFARTLGTLLKSGVSLLPA
ncbi:MAG TPA: type II secretion system F family protein, partial [Verrucomicrobiae bacterium]|nr:type II secretion system F family protein [Verrucomicrobiae bacterium]